MGIAAKLTGFRWFERNKRDWRAMFRWAEISGGFGLSIGLMWYGDDEDDCSFNVRIGWPNIYFKLRLPKPMEPELMQPGPHYGISVHRYDMHLNWGQRCKIIHFPWSWDWVRTSHMMKDGTWLHELSKQRREGFPNYPLALSEGRPHFYVADLKELMWSESYQYRYVLRSGEVQLRVATLRVDEREWRFRWFKWLPFPRHIQRTIGIDFDAEVGERTGSWKGGCTGCSYELRHDEMPEEALRRMESERVFR